MVIVFPKIWETQTGESTGRRRAIAMTSVQVPLMLFRRKHNITLYTGCLISNRSKRNCGKSHGFVVALVLKQCRPQFGRKSGSHHVSAVVARCSLQLVVQGTILVRIQTEAHHRCRVDRCRLSRRWRIICATIRSANVSILSIFSGLDSAGF